MGNNDEGLMTMWALLCMRGQKFSGRHAYTPNNDQIVARTIKLQVKKPLDVITHPPQIDCKIMRF